MKILILSLLSVLFNFSILIGQKNLTETEKDSINLLKLRQKYSTIISYEKASFVGANVRTSLVRKGANWRLIYWVKKKIKEKKTGLGGTITHRYVQKKQAISTEKGDSILAFFINQQFSSLDMDSLNTQIGPNDSTFISLSHCPTESIYFYHDKRVVEKQAYCLFLYYKNAPNQHKTRFLKCSNAFLALSEIEKNQ